MNQQEPFFPVPVVTPPSIEDMNANKAAELRADAHALEGKWESFAQPGFEMSAGTIAVEAAVKSGITNEFTSEESAEITKSENTATEPSLFEVVGDTSRPGVQEGVADVYTVKDSRRVTLHSVEADFQAKKTAEAQNTREKEEALRQPLDNKEIMAVTDAIGSSILESHKEGKVGHQPKGDLLALFRLNSMAEGQALQFGNDPSNKHKKLSLEERLDDLVEQYASQRSVDENTRAVAYAGYSGGLYYQFARARQILRAINDDPKTMRQDVIDAKGSVSEAVEDRFTAAMVVPNDEIVPKGQLIKDGDRLTPHATDPGYYYDWLKDLSKPAA